ncbi:uncharacterized protein LOC128396046 [Panonychus citri]|uniref:uncharacterized protein LOC128396046 n=1 Tax=Panonychus citri TaxID=50023 RepID=UPI002306F502|nr:uncharacterized protein LOC128396046 [Panonychus citri]
MKDNKSVWNKIFAIRESFYKHFQGEVTTHNVQIQSEWYAFSHWIYVIYRKSFATREERKSFEYNFIQCSSNVERVNCFMDCQPIQAKFAKSAKKLWYQSDLPSKRGLQALKKWLIKNNFFANGSTNCSTGFDTLIEKVEDPFAELEKLANPEEEIEEILIKGPPVWEDYVENDSLRGVSNLVQLGNHPVKRRQLLASADIPKGSVIAREEALCVWLAPIMYDTYCYRCLCPLPEVRLTCQGCKMVNFCSTDCFDSAKNTFHGKECNYMGMLKHLSIFHFTLRMLLAIGPKKVVAASVSKFMSSANPPEDEFYPSFEGGDDVSSFLNLESGVQGVSNSDMLTFSCTALFCCHLLREMSFFDVAFPEKPLFCSLISMMILISRNIFTLYDHTFRMLKVPETSDLIIEGPGKEIGHGLFYKTSLFNHSCSPNAHAVFFGASIVVITTKDIGAKEEITISYGAKYPEMKFEDRQVKLRNNFYFNCLCEQCETELIERARVKTCDQCFDSLYQKITSGQVYVNETGEILPKDQEDDNGDSIKDQKCSDCTILVKKKHQWDKIRTLGLEYYAKARKLIHKEEYKRAIRYLNKSLQQFTEVDDLWYMFLVRDDLVTCLRALDEYEEAFEHCWENLKTRGDLYEKDSATYANQLLITLECAKDAGVAACKDKIESMTGENVIKTIVDSFNELHDQLSNHQGKFIEHNNQHYIDFLTRKDEYTKWLKDIVQQSTNIDTIYNIS